MALVCLPSDALSQHLLSYLGFSYLRRGVSLHGCSSKAQPLLLTLDEGYLLTAAPPDLERGVAPLGPPAPAQQPLLGGSKYIYIYGFLGGSVIMNLPANTRDAGLIPGLGTSPEEGNSNLLQYSCLEIPMARGAWWATAHGVTKELDMTE